MSYRGSYFTYGEKDTAGIEAITGMVEGDSVWNTDYFMPEYYNGNVWVLEGGSVVTAGATVVQGEIVAIRTSGKVTLGTTSDDVTICGVVHHGGADTEEICIINHGRALCLAGATIVLGQYATMDGTAGRYTDTTSASTGTFGRCVEANTDGNLGWVLLSLMERQ
jgi:hypothetical protein